MGLQGVSSSSSNCTDEAMTKRWTNNDKHVRLRTASRDPQGVDGKSPTAKVLSRVAGPMIDLGDLVNAVEVALFVSPAWPASLKNV